ncbi:MAG: YgiQ family radical SAM protein [Bacteroidales bacterium]
MICSFQDLWLPASRKEVLARGWDELDVILFSGDAYVDHPSFGIAVLGRVLENMGLHVAIVPQPNWRDDLRDFKKLGKPRLFFGVSAGAMDSMVNHYTAGKRLRSDDAYTPDGKAGQRPDYPTIVYTRILKQLFPDTPVIIGGIEASMRRFTHYDYWQDKLKPSILIESGADMLVYGMGEKAIMEIARLMDRGVPMENLVNIAQTAVIVKKNRFYSGDERSGKEAGSSGSQDKKAGGAGSRDEAGSSGSQDKKAGGDGITETIRLHSHEECLKDKKSYAGNFSLVEVESNKLQAARILQSNGNLTVVVNPPFPAPEEKEIDKIYDLPFTRLPHPRYRNKGAIPAYEMIRHSVTLHRGCFGGCSFCTISAHQGKFVSSRSEGSVLKEVESVTRMPDFKGYISDLGGPSANMYKMQGKDMKVCARCRKPSCIFPVVCPNLETSPAPLLSIYRKVRSMPGIKKAFVGSGIRYDLFLGRMDQEGYRDYAKELIKHHVSGRLKVAPEHSDEQVLKLMRKPPFSLYRKMQKLFDKVNKEEGLNQQLIPYFISSHPGCGNIEMAELAVISKEMNIRPEQVQDFTPTPMTLATVIFYAGINPYTMERISVAKTRQEKQAQQQFFFWYKKEYRNQIRKELLKMGRKDLAGKLMGYKK